jgi:hypothetical protein
MVSVSVDAPDLLKQVRKLSDFPRVAKEEFSRAMTEAIYLSVLDIQARSPIGTGELRGATSGEIRFAAGEEVRGVMTNEARAPDGFPYAYALDASPRYHFRGRRKQTKGYFRGVIRRRRKDVLARFEAVPPRILQRMQVNPTAGGG